MAESVLVTGATGLIGAALVRRFAEDGLRVFAAARNANRARELFRGIANVDVCEWDVTQPFDILSTGLSWRHVDWLVHAAAETSTRNFIEKPVETIVSILDGTKNVLELARAAGVTSMVYLSSMEVYGAPTVETVTEADIGYLDPVRLRSNYPEAKRMAENLCVSYAKEYGVPVKIARLAQTFGEGVRAEDARVYAQFARAILDGRDLVLKTDGSSARCYCYLGDAVEAIRILLARGRNAMPYTVANEETFCTVREMAERLVAEYPESGSRLVFDISEESAGVYPPPSLLKLDSSRLRALGWAPKVGLMEAFRRMMGGMRKMALAIACLFALSSEATQYALVVGINEYTNPGCETLDGCVTDASRMYSLLINGGGGWVAENVTKLTDAAASSAAIQAAIRSYAGMAVSDDTFIYFQSSHGVDQKLCAADVDISAAELGGCLREFKSGVKVLCVIDACHSGGLPGKDNAESKGKGAMRNPIDFSAFVADVEKNMSAPLTKGKAVTAKASNGDVGWCVAVDSVNTSNDLGTAFGGLFTYPFVQSALSGAADATCFTCKGINLSHGNGDGDCTAEEAFWSAYGTALIWSGWWQAPQIFNDDVCAKVVLAKSQLTDVNVAADTDLPFDSYAYDFANYGVERGAGFFGQTKTSCDGVSALACSPVIPFQVCVLETSVEAGTISFSWRTSSGVARDARHLRLLVDGTVVREYSGETWRRESVSILGADAHKVQWEYYAWGNRTPDPVMITENRAYIDMVKWVPVSHSSTGYAETVANKDDVFMLDFANAGAFQGKGIYSGYILNSRGGHEAAGAVAGLITAKTSKFKRDGSSVVAAAVSIMGQRNVVRIKGRGVRNSGDARLLSASFSGAGLSAQLSFLHKTAWGWVDFGGIGYWCNMSRSDVSPDAIASVRGNYVLGAYAKPTADSSSDSYVGLSVQVGARGATRFAGMLPDGTRINGQTTAIVDDSGVYVPIFARANSSRGALCGFIVDVVHCRLAHDSSGLWNNAGSGCDVRAELVFDMFGRVRDAPSVSENCLFESFGEFPQTTRLKFDGRKWTQMVPDGQQLQLAYRTRTGMMRGSFVHVTPDGHRQRVSCNGIYLKNGGKNGRAMLTVSAKGGLSTYAVIR